MCIAKFLGFYSISFFFLIFEIPAVKILHLIKSVSSYASQKLDWGTN